MTWRKSERKNGRITDIGGDGYGRGAALREETISASRRRETPQAAQSLAASSKHAPTSAAMATSGPLCQSVRWWRHPVPYARFWHV